MKNWYRVAAIATLALTFTVTSALAAGDAAKKAADNGKGAPAASPKTGAAGMKGAHMMTGEVTKIDKDKGFVSVKTPETTLDLHFPPTALKNVEKGDRVTVELGLKEAAAGAASPRMDKGAKGAKGAAGTEKK